VDAKRLNPIMVLNTATKNIGTAVASEGAKVSTEQRIVTTSTHY
jgi:hypothetical protein